MIAQSNATGVIGAKFDFDYYLSVRRKPVQLSRGDLLPLLARPNQELKMWDLVSLFDGCFRPCCCEMILPIQKRCWMGVAAET